MATTQTKSGTQNLNGLFERTTQAQEQFATAAHRAGHAYLDTYEKTVDRAIDLQIRFADSTGQDWLKSVTESQTDFTRELAHSYTSTARTMLS